MSGFDAAELDVAVQRNDLHRALGMTGRATGNRTTMPILSHVLIESDGARLRCTSTDLSTSVTVWINGRVRQPGRLCVPQALLLELVSSLPAAGEVTLSARGATARVECGRVGANLKAADANDFPPLALLDDAAPVATISAEAFRAAVAQVAFAAAKDEARPVLAGVNLIVEDGAVRLAAADGYRMSMRVARPDEWAQTDVIVPAKALAEAARAALPDATAAVTMHVTAERNLLGFRMPTAAGDAIIVTRLLTGQYPDLRRVTPTEHATKCVVPRDELARAVRIAAIFAEDVGNALRLNIDAAEGCVTVSGAAAETGDNETRVSAVVEGADAAIALSSAFLGEYLGATRAESVALYVNGPTSPVRLEALGSETDWTHVIMPMHVAGA